MKTDGTQSGGVGLNGTSFKDDAQWSALRYVLGEMSADEAEAYERILPTDSQACERVASATLLATNLYSVLAQEIESESATRAAASLPAAVRNARQSIIDETLKKQQPDGSWTIAALGPWKDHPAAPPANGASAYATAVAAFALEQAGLPRSDPKLKKALDWLRSKQDPQFGYWAADSMNKRREPGNMPEGFMRDAATAFAVLALIGPAPAGH